jgi:hypothetical protein
MIAYINRTITYIILFLIILLVGSEHLYNSIAIIIQFAEQLDNKMHHLITLYLLPAYLAFVIFGAGALSIFLVSKLEKMIIYFFSDRCK